MSGPPLLELDRVGVALPNGAGGLTPILSDVSVALPRGTVLGIVGESGSGKSLLALAVMGLLPPGAVVTGAIRLDGRDLVPLGEEERCGVRGQRIGMIFQEPLTALNPSMRVGDQIAEGIVWHRGCTWATARREAVRLLDQVRIPDAARRARSHPHELSGGQRQRVGIAIALALEPDLMIADEPTTALDVTVQAEILDILDDLVRDRGMSMILVSHDLGVIARAADRTVVLYAGTRLEEGTTADVLHRPLNPYTRGLLAAMPRRRGLSAPRLDTIPGTVPRFADPPSGCRFAPRCGFVVDACRAGEPDWTVKAPHRGVRCIRADEIGPMETPS